MGQPTAALARYNAMDDLVARGYLDDDPPVLPPPIEVELPYSRRPSWAVWGVVSLIVTLAGWL